MIKEPSALGLSNERRKKFYCSQGPQTVPTSPSCNKRL